jgi:hypothetical protein
MDKPADPATRTPKSTSRSWTTFCFRQEALNDPPVPLQHRAVREVARRQRQAGDPGVTRADHPLRLPPASRDTPAAAARFDPPAPRRPDEPPHRPLLPPEHQVPRVVAGRRRPPRCQPVPSRRSVLQEVGRHAGPASGRPDPEDGQAVRCRVPACRLRRRWAGGPPRPGSRLPALLLRGSDRTIPRN